MAIFEITSDQIRAISETTFEEAGLRERFDLQRLLRKQIEIISPDTLVISEEFGDWEDSKRRIDLLGLDKDGNLVVFELKRTEDGGHMELQAIRYASMVAAMTFVKAVEVYAAYLSRIGATADARESMLSFLGWDQPDEDQFAQDVRIVLVSAEFSKELTTAVLWLNERELDIRCVRLKPYADNGRTLIDVQQVVPLPEAADYQIKLRDKEVRERSARREQSELSKLFYGFWAGLLPKAKTKTPIHANISPTTGTWISATAGVRGLTLVYAFGRQVPRVELYIDTGDQQENKRIYDQLLREKVPVENRFGGSLGWERLDDRRACRIRFDLPAGSVRDEANWPALQDQMIEAMIRLEKALRPILDTL